MGAAGMKRAVSYVAGATVSGVLGWIALIGIFEGWYWASSFATHLRRERRKREESC
jgi:hypothetical protein